MGAAARYCLLGWVTNSGHLSYPEPLEPPGDIPGGGITPSPLVHHLSPGDPLAPLEHLQVMPTIVSPCHPGAYPPRRSPLARCGRCCCWCGCRRGTRLPCSPPPGARRLPLPAERGWEWVQGLSRHLTQSCTLSSVPALLGKGTSGCASVGWLVAPSSHHAHTGYRLSPMTNTGMKAPQGTGMVVARADIQNCTGDTGTH